MMQDDLLQIDLESVVAAVVPRGDVGNATALSIISTGKCVNCE